jgi:DNA-binding PadR family transcriptional regulator
MNAIETEPGELLPLTPAVFHILLALADGERHGYAVMQEVAANTRGQMQMGPGTLYGTIKRMLAANLIEESDERPAPDLDDERRRYYRLTGLGRKVLAAEVERLANLVSLAQSKKLTGESSSQFQTGAA